MMVQAFSCKWTMLQRNSADQQPASSEDESVFAKAVLGVGSLGVKQVDEMLRAGASGGQPTWASWKSAANRHGTALHILCSQYRIRGGDGGGRSGGAGGDVFSEEDAMLAIYEVLAQPSPNICSRLCAC